MATGLRGGEVGSSRPATRGMGPVQILTAAILWGTTGTTQALAPAGVSTAGVAALRVVVGGVALVAVALLRRALPARGLSLVRACIPAGALVGAQLCFFAAVERTGVAVGTVVSIGSAPVLGGALTWLFRRHAPGRRWAFATAMALVGCALLLTAGRSLEVDPFGVALALVVGAGYAAYTLTTRDLVSSHSPDAVTAIVFGLAAAAMAPVLAVVPLEPMLSPWGVAATAHLGLLTVAFAYSIFTRGLRHVRAADALTLTLAEPLTATVLGAVVLDERLTLPAWAGTGLILSSLVALSVEPGRDDAPTES
jgi:DME family drug/metabolite transporter